VRRPVRTIVRIAAVFLLAALAYRYWKDPEKTVIDAADRAGAPGKFVALTNGVTHYDLTGPDTARLVVLVHGFSVPYYIWDSTAVTLGKAGYRVLRYDLYGRGLSDRPDVTYDGALYDRQLGDLLDSLHVTGPIDLAGVSFGGFVTAHYTAGHAARVRTLTLVDPVSGAGQLPWALRQPVLGPWLWQVTRVPGMAEGQSSDFLHPEHFPTWADQYRPQMRFRGFGRSLLSSSVSMSHVSFDSLYSQVAKTGVPVLLIWGKQDHTIPIAMSEVVRRNIPAAEYAPIDSSGHLPHIEQTKIFHERMIAFFEAHRPPAK